MLTITLIGDKNFSLKDIEKVNHLGSIKTYYSVDMLEYIVEFEEFVSDEKLRRIMGLPKGYKVGSAYDALIYSLATYEDDCIKLDYPKEKLSRLSFKAEIFVNLRFSFIKTMKRILRQSDFPQNIYVCDDFGSILSLHDFNKLDWNSEKGSIPCN